MITRKNVKTKRTAQSFVEYAMLFAIIVVITITVSSMFTGNKNITKLSNMSKITLRGE